LDGEQAGYGSDKVWVGAIIEFPHRDEGTMVMQSQIGAAIRSGDVAHAAAFRDLMHSVRKGNPQMLVGEPGKAERRQFAPDQ
jgi:hypothetical protein